MKFNINEEQLKGIGKIGLRIGKAIVVEGTKAVVLKGTAVAINASFENGIEGVKNLSLGDVLKDEKDSNEKKGLFRRKKKEVQIETVETKVTKETVEV